MTFQRLAGAPDVADTILSIPHPYKYGMAEKWIGGHQFAFKNGTDVHFTVVKNDGNDLVGAISLMRVDQTHVHAKLGYLIGVPFWNRGFCTEAANAVLSYAFDELNLNRVWAHHVTRNPASGRVMQKIGMQHEGCLRKHIRKASVFEDIEAYGILRSEWKTSAPQSSPATKTVRQTRL